MGQPAGTGQADHRPAGGAATGWSGPALIYSIRDIDSANPDDREDNLGALLTMDWQPKYAASVLAP
jgi:hypothetical protein